MRTLFSRQRRGATLIELMLFSAFFLIASTAVLILMFTSSEQRARQQLMATVDQNGVQMMQTLTRRIRRAERIIEPAIRETGSIGYFQMASQVENPTIVALQSGALVVAEHSDLKILSSEQVVVSALQFRNTSVATNRQSILISFTIEPSGNWPQSFGYSRDFESLVTLFTDDDPEGSSCGCAIPECLGGTYLWEVCEEDVCESAPITLPCS